MAIIKHLEISSSNVIAECYGVGKSTVSDIKKNHDKILRFAQQMTMTKSVTTVWPEILAGNLFWQIGGFESNPPIFHLPKTSQCDVIIIAKS